jgi:hypothetical protein
VTYTLPVLSFLYGTLNILSYTVQLNLLCGRHVKCSVMYICFVHEYVVQFDTEDFHCGNLLSVI